MMTISNTEKPGLTLRRGWLGSPRCQQDLFENQKDLLQRNFTFPFSSQKECGGNVLFELASLKWIWKLNDLFLRLWEAGESWQVRCLTSNHLPLCQINLPTHPRCCHSQERACVLTWQVCSCCRAGWGGGAQLCRCQWTPREPCAN